MPWIGIAIGVLVVAWGYRKYRDSAARAWQFVSQPAEGQFLLVVFAGLVIAVLSVMAHLVGTHYWRRSPHAKIAIPARVLQAIEAAIDTGVLTRTEAADVNEWLNYDVRIQSREIEVVEAENVLAVPMETLVKVASRKVAGADDKQALASFMADVAINVATSGPDISVRTGELEAVRTAITQGTVSDSEAEMLRNMAASAAYRYGLTPTDYGIPESYGPKIGDHPAPLNGPSPLDTVPMPPAP